jgi:hypothetical protein
MSESTFGSKVVGEEAAAKAAAAAKGGGEVFGKRVTGAIAEPSADYLAKKNSEFGARVIGNARAQDHKGSSGDGGSPSVKDLENILEENPTTFDSLYEAELARSEGPRKAALEIFVVVENGIKGAGRPQVLNEINHLLGKDSVTAAQRADHLRATATQIEEQQQRMDDNVKLQDADRIQSLRDREDNLEVLRKSGNRSTKSQLGAASPDTDAQVRSIADRDGLDVGGPAADAGKQEGGGRGAHSDLAEGDVKPESSQTTKRSSQKKGSRRKSSAKK